MNDELNYYKELRSYLTGFILALLLTIVPFALVAWGNFPSHITLIIIAVFGLATFPGFSATAANQNRNPGFRLIDAVSTWSIFSAYGRPGLPLSRFGANVPTPC
jgi:hypothetical protein